MPCLGQCNLPGKSLKQNSKKHLSARRNSDTALQVIATFVSTKELPITTICNASFWAWYTA